MEFKIVFIFYQILYHNQIKKAAEKALTSAAC